MGLRLHPGTENRKLLDPALAKARAATALAADVRIVVTVVPSMMATGSPSSPSRTVTSAEIVGMPRFALAGLTLEFADRPGVRSQPCRVAEGNGVLVALDQQPRRQHCFPATERLERELLGPDRQVDVEQAADVCGRKDEQFLFRGHFAPQSHVGDARFPSMVAARSVVYRRRSRIPRGSRRISYATTTYVRA